MKEIEKSRPAVLSISGHDPGGGAGIQADIEAIHAHNAYAMSIITCLTRQDTRSVYEIQPIDADFILRQAETLLNDMQVDVIKIGLIGSLANVDAIRQILLQIPHIPVVLDPVLAAGGGEKLSSSDIADAINNQLLPLTTLVTPNIPEAFALANLSENHSETLDCAAFFSERGCSYALITGTHSGSAEVNNLLYKGSNLLSTTSWPRLDGSFHGSGCTLASSIAALIANRIPLEKSVIKAQDYTWKSLQNATRQGHFQYIPQR